MSDFDLPADFFWAGSPEATAENHLKHLENTLLRELVQEMQNSKVPQAAQHFQGCSRRLMMMQYARLEILATAKEEQKPLESQRLNLQNICLNSYYLNLLGALDNLAWALTHEFHLLPIIDESKDDVRRFCSLTSKRFTAILRDRHPEFADWLIERSSWISDVKRFRDPAAHRLPLAIVRGIMTEEEGQRYRELSKQSWDALLSDQWEESARLQTEADALGRFVPLLDGPRGPDEGIYIVPNQMAADQRAFLALAHGFVQHLAHCRLTNVAADKHFSVARSARNC
jgi:hypothetical protein